MSSQEARNLAWINNITRRFKNKSHGVLGKILLIERSIGPFLAD
jgi:hypothetical protein